MKLIVIKYCLIFQCFLGWLPHAHASAEFPQSTDSIPAKKHIHCADQFYQKAQYDSAFRHYKLACDNIRMIDTPGLFTECLIKLGNTTREQGQYIQSLRYYFQAEKVQLSRPAPSNNMLLNTLQQIGMTYINVGKYDSSFLYIQRALILSKELNKADSTRATLYNILGNNQYYRGHFKEALNFYSMALNAETGKVLPDMLKIASYHQNIGIINAIDGEYDLAENSLLKTLSIREAYLPPDSPDLARIYVNIGRFYYELDKFDNALFYYQKAEDIYIKKFSKEYSYLGHIYANKGNIYVDMSDFEKALNYYKRSLQIFQKNYTSNHQAIGMVNMNIGVIYYKKHDFAKALDFYHKSISINPKSPSSIKSYRNIAEIYSRINNDEEAQHYLKLAIEKSMEVYGKQHYETALSYESYAKHLQNQNPDDKDILPLLKKSSDILHQIYQGKHRLKAMALNNIGHYYFQKKNYHTALGYYQQAIVDNIKYDFDSNEDMILDSQKLQPDITLLNSILFKAQTLENIGLLNNNINQQQLALDNYNTAIQLIDRIRNSFSNKESKLHLQESNSRTYPAATQVALTLYNKSQDKSYINQAFTYAEKGKSSDLLSSIRELTAKNIGNIDPDIQATETTLRENLGSYRKLIYDESNKTHPNKNKLTLWNEKLFDLSNSLDSIIIILEKNYPDYYLLKYDNSVISIQQIQKKLKPNDALIEYVKTDSLLTIFTITPDTFTVINNKVDSTFTNAIDELHQSVLAKEFANYTLNDYNNFCQQSYFLYQTLIQPIKKLIDKKNLIIIPDNEIGYISFDILIDSIPHSNRFSFKTLPYLIKEHAISYAPGATILFYERADKKQASKKLLAFAPSYDTPNLEAEDLIYRNTLTNSGRNSRDLLLPIPGVKEEIDNISKVIHANKFMDKQATELNFKKNASQYSILHLAMHALVNQTNPWFSKMVFYQNNDSIEDGLLNTYELLNMNLSASMAVLSACNTGYGKIRPGEGIQSLALGFLYSGIPSVIMTLWNIEDNSSQQLMTGFYRELSNDLTKDQALRQAKLTFLEQSDNIRAHPHYWSAYVCFGNTDALPHQKTTFSKTVIFSSLFGCLLLLSVIFYLYRKRR